MAPKKGVPHRIGFTNEPRFPKNRRNLLKPVHGATPRCRVDYSPEDDGPWTAIQIMRIDEDGSIEHYMCAMPRYYAIPLILLNKRLAYAEAQCTPDGTPLSLGDGSQGLKLRDLKEFTYLWRVRCRFLQGVFDMNHEQQLDEAWRWDRIHGYMHRTYKRYGHDISQRYAYWKDEIEAGRMPYSKPDIADMGTSCPAPPLPHIPLPQPQLGEYHGPADVCFFTACKKTGKPSLWRKRPPAPASTRSIRELAGVAQGLP